MQSLATKFYASFTNNAANHFRRAQLYSYNCIVLHRNTCTVSYNAYSTFVNRAIMPPLVSFVLLNMPRLDSTTTVLEQWHCLFLAWRFLPIRNSTKPVSNIQTVINLSQLKWIRKRNSHLVGFGIVRKFHRVVVCRNCIVGIRIRPQEILCTFFLLFLFLLCRNKHR